MMRRTHQRGVGGAVGGRLAALCIGLGFPVWAQAQVLEIADSGEVIVHDRPEVTLYSGVTPIETAAASHGGRGGLAARDPSALSRAAQSADLSPDLIEAVAWTESRGRPGVVSSAGAVGEMQLMPGTAKALGVNPFDSQQNYSGGAVYLSGLLKRYDGDVVRALAAYNAGPTSVDRYGGVPPFKETQDYVAAILDRLSRRAAAPER